MSEEFSALNFSDDLSEVLKVEDAMRWKIERPGNLEVWALVYSISAHTEIYQARFLWKVYPDEPPSLKFRDPATGRLDLPGAWPRVRGFRPTNLDACVNWVLEGFIAHPEWKTDPRLRWNPNGNVLLLVLRTLQAEMDYYYEGRHQ